MTKNDLTLPLNRQILIFQANVRCYYSRGRRFVVGWSWWRCKLDCVNNNKNRRLMIQPVTLPPSEMVHLFPGSNLKRIVTIFLQQFISFLFSVLFVHEIQRVIIRTKTSVDPSDLYKIFPVFFVDFFFRHNNKNYGFLMTLSSRWQSQIIRSPLAALLSGCNAKTPSVNTQKKAPV